MAGLDREVELQIRAQDYSGKTIKEVKNNLSAAFGRLCVETSIYARSFGMGTLSRLRAAVC